MAWGSAFKQALLEDVLYPRFIFESVAMSGDGADPFGGHLRLRSYISGSNQGYIPAMVRQGSQIDHGRVQPGSWRRSFSTLRIAVAPWYDPRSKVVRGSTVALKVGFSEAIDTFETVFVGQVRDIRMDARGYYIECVSLEGALTSRFTSTAGEFDLFANLRDRSPVVSVAYTAGAANITVSNVSGFEQSLAAGGEGYMLLVTGNSGNQFYIKATTLVGTTFSGLSAGLFGTTDEDANVLNAVSPSTYSEGHPIDIVRAMLVSTGNNLQNGPRDFLPETWAFGIPQQFVDEADMGMFVTATTVGTDGWVLLATEPQNNPWAWIEGWLGQAGFFFTLHEGQITVRAILDPNKQTGYVTHVRQGDIVDVISFSSWSQDVPQEYYFVLPSKGLAGALSPEIRSRPAGYTKTMDLSGIRTNINTAVDEPVDRLAPFYTRIPEHGVLRLRGWKYAQLAPGDVFLLSAPDLLQPRGNYNYDQYVGRRCLCVGGGPNWFGATTDIEFLALPQDEVEI